jgi:hypothetical protein
LVEDEHGEPNRRVPKRLFRISSCHGRVAMTGEQASAELRSLMCDEDKKWFYAYGVGAGSTIEGNNEISVTIRRRVAELRAVIAVHRKGS